MPETNLFEFSIESVTSSELKIKVKNISKTALDGHLLIEVTAPMQLVDAKIRDAAMKARTNKNPQNMASLDGVVTGPAGWSVWAFNERKDHIAVVRFINNVDQQTGQKTAKSVKVDADANFTLRFPLNAQAIRTQIVSIPYGYQSGPRGKRIDGALDLIPSDMGEWRPTVVFKTDKQNPTMLEPRTEVKISWEIKDGVSATLRGPLSNGNSELTLSTDPTSDFRIEEGSFKFLAVGSATYILDAEVLGPENKPNVQVIRTIQVDVVSAKNYAFLDVRPKVVLPNGMVEIDWTVWGVEEATIRVGTRKSLDLELTEQNLNRHYQGSGTLRVRALDNKTSENVNLTARQNDRELTPPKGEIQVSRWSKPIKDVKFTGKPLGLAMASDQLALLTDKGLWLAAVGEDDSGETEKVKFRQVTTDGPKAWLALTAFDKDFVALRQLAQDGLQLVRYTSAGDRKGLAVDLPDTVKAMVRTPGTVYDLAWLGDRIYVVVETPVPGGSMRRAFSVGFERQANLRPEPLLEPLPGYRLLFMDGALYAINRASGWMFRFTTNETGRLDRPGKAASAISDGKSMIDKGLFIAASSVLVVLSPESVPTSEEGTPGLLNLDPPRNAGDIPQDLVYNPQKDRWAACGNGLTVKDGAVAAFRGGISKRLWVLQPDGEMRTLSGASEDLFARDYVRKSQYNGKFPSKPLPPFLDAEREFEIVKSGPQFVPVEDTCRMAGLDDFSSSGPAEVTPLPVDFTNRNHETIRIAYNKADPGTIKLRFMCGGNPAARHRYVAELTFSGPDLSVITSVFKRVAVDERGALSVADVPDSRAQHSPENRFVVDARNLPFIGRRLYIFNLTPYDLSLTPSQTEPILHFSDMNLRYDSPPLSVFIPDLGELRFDVDFALPSGIEVSSGSAPQKSQIRINTGKALGMEVRLARMLNQGDAPLKVEYRLGAFDVRSEKQPVYVCQIGYGLKKKLEGVYIGDGVSNKTDNHFYLPLAYPEDLSKTQILKIDNQTFTPIASMGFNGEGNVFSLPNSVTVSSDKVFAMFGNTELLTLDESLQVKSRKNYEDPDSYFTTVHSLKATADGGVYMLIMKEKHPSLWDKDYHYSLIVERGQRTEISLDAVPGVHGGSFNVQPAWLESSLSWMNPMAVSSSGDKVAIGIPGGLMIIDVPSRKTQVISLADAKRGETTVSPTIAEDITFSDLQTSILCAHSRSDHQGVIVSRIQLRNMEKDSILLPAGERSIDLTNDTSGVSIVGVKIKTARAFSIALDAGESSLFVSQGRTIMRVLLGFKLSIDPWQATVELPCRLIQVKSGSTYKSVTNEGHPRFVYAIGARYEGDGSKVDPAKGYETHLYMLTVL